MLEQKHNKRAAISQASSNSRPRWRGRSPRHLHIHLPGQTPRIRGAGGGSRLRPRRAGIRADPQAHEPQRLGKDDARQTGPGASHGKATLS